MSGILTVLAAWVLILVLIGVGYRALKAWLKGLFRAPRTEFGSAHWMSPQELQATGLINERSGIVLGRVGGRTLRDAGEGHVLLVAPSRGGGIHGVFGGKGTTCVLPTLFEWTGDCVCIDPKGENHDTTGPWRAAHGSLVYSFDPMGDTSETQIDLLKSIRLGTPHALADADVLAHGFIPDPGPQHPGARYYAKDAANILSSVLLYVAECADDPTMGGALHFMTTAQPIAKRLSTMLASPHPAVTATAQQLLHLDERTRQPLWSAAVDGLSLWRDPRICARTQRNDVDLGAFQTGEQPISLFLRSPESQLEHLSPLMRTVVQVVIGRAMERSIDRGRRELLFLLDEFSSMGGCLPIVTALPRMAGYQLRCAIICQDLSDIERLYGRSSNIVQNCAARAFMTPNDVTTALYISRLLGVETVETLSERTGTSSSGVHFGSQEGESIGVAARGLWTLDEVLRMPESHLLVFLSGQPPLLAEKIRFDDPGYFHKRGAHADATTA